MNAREAGFTALETTIAAGLIAMLFAALGTGIVHESTAFQSAARGDALAAAAREELRIAADALKYDGSSLQTSSVATTVPMPVGSPLSAQLSLSTEALPGGALLVRVRASSGSSAGSLVREATLVVERRMPVPGSSAIAPTQVAAPFGAP
uniref:Uncharacterized protein n=1 Tax=mine drainage metagenome TaxID=410659 RepID=E6Q1F0_9ZZZZ